MLFVRGMHGLGDNVHQRGVIRQLLASHEELWLETSWPALYHDLAAVRCVARPDVTLRTQRKNVAREWARFHPAPQPRNCKFHQISYSPDAVRRHGSVFEAMCATSGVDAVDFRLPVPESWRETAFRILGGIPERPLLVYRPLVERREWTGCVTRNPLPTAYAELFARLRDRFYVVSVADLVPGEEWAVGRPIRADRELHGGEMHIEALAGLVASASLVWTSPGFAVPLAQAVGTPVVCVFGGYESARSFSFGSRFAPYLGIEPIAPCECFSHTHRCRKEIDLPAAAAKLDAFIDALTPNPPAA